MKKHKSIITVDGQVCLVLQHLFNNHYQILRGKEKSFAKQNKDGSWRVAGKWEVAQNSFTPPEILKTLAKDEDWSVRHRVAQNTSTPPELLEMLAEDEDEYVQIQAHKRIKYHESR
jgi:hypothetical protein